MSQANVEVVKRLFESYRRGDYEEAAACLAADVVYEVAQELPLRGREEVRAMWERWDSTWDEMETVPEDFLDAGDQVLVTVYYSARGRGSGIEYEERLFDVYSFSDGQCVRKREFRERSEAAEAAGLDHMTNSGLAASYRRYNACCNEHRFEDLAEFVARDVAIDGTERGLDAYAAELRAVVHAFPDYRWELRRLVVEAPWIAAHFTDTGTHREAFLGVQATGRSVSVPEFAFYRVDAGQIVEAWGSAFHVHLLEQLR